MFTQIKAHFDDLLILIKLVGLHTRQMGLTEQEREYQLAVAELKSYSDRDLLDLGLTRGSIDYAVRHGRPGIEEGLAVPGQNINQCEHPPHQLAA